MKKKITYTDEPLGNVQVVEDFLPPPEQLVFKEGKIKVKGYADTGKSESMDYSPSTFDKSIYATSFGHRLWYDFLTQDEIIGLMENASDNGKPAVEPLNQRLPGRYKQDFDQCGQVDLFKQMIGRMIRQILEGRGYELERGSVLVEPPGEFFTTGSVYRRKA